MEEFEWGCGAGWQHEARTRVERHHRDSHIFPRLADPAKALLRSQGGPGSVLVFSTSPTCRITRLGSHHFRLLLLRRLQHLLPLTVRSCQCGRPLAITALPAHGLGSECSPNTATPHDREFLRNSLPLKDGHSQQVVARAHAQWRRSNHADWTS